MIALGHWENRKGVWRRPDWAIGAIDLAAADEIKASSVGSDRGCGAFLVRPGATVPSEYHVIAEVPTAMDRSAWLSHVGSRVDGATPWEMVAEHLKQSEFPLMPGQAGRLELICGGSRHWSATFRPDNSRHCDMVLRRCCEAIERSDTPEESLDATIQKLWQLPTHQQRRDAWNAGGLIRRLATGISPKQHGTNITENFDGPDVVGSIGYEQPWTVGGVNQWQNISNQGARAGTNDTSPDKTAICDTTLSVDDLSVALDVTLLGGNNDFQCGPFGRVSNGGGSSVNGYVYMLLGVGLTQLYKILNNGFTLIDDYSPPSVSYPVPIKVICDGSTISGDFNGVGGTVSATDTSIFGVNAGGIWARRRTTASVANSDNWVLSDELGPVGETVLLGFVGEVDEALPLTVVEGSIPDLVLLGVADEVDEALPLTVLLAPRDGVSVRQSGSAFNDSVTLDVQAGNSLFALHMVNSVTTPTVSDDRNGSYTQIELLTSDGRTASVFYVSDVQGGLTTISASPLNSFDLVVVEVTGAGSLPQMESSSFANSGTEDQWASAVDKYNAAENSLVLSCNATSPSGQSVVPQPGYMQLPTVNSNGSTALYREVYGATFTRPGYTKNSLITGAGASVLILPGAIQLGIVDEIDEALPLTVLAPVTIQLGIVDETDTVQPLSVDAPQTVALGIVDETDTALPLAVDAPELVALGVADEVDEALPLSVDAPLTLELGVVDETDTALPLMIDAPGMVNLGTVEETDEALPLTVIAAVPIPLGVVDEVDEAIPLTVVVDLNVPLGVVDEVDEALALTVLGPVTVTLGLVDETDEALPLQITSGTAGLVQIEDVTISGPHSEATISGPYAPATIDGP